MMYFTLGTGLAGFIACIFWLKSVKSRSDMFYAVFTMIGCVIWMAMGLSLLLDKI